MRYLRLTSFFTFDGAQDSLPNKYKDFSDTNSAGKVTYGRQGRANKRSNDLLVDMVDMRHLHLHQLSKLRILQLFA